MDFNAARALQLANGVPYVYVIWRLGTEHGHIALNLETGAIIGPVTATATASNLSVTLLEFARWDNNNHHWEGTIQSVAIFGPHHAGLNNAMQFLFDPYRYLIKPASDIGFVPIAGGADDYTAQNFMLNTVQIYRAGR